MEVIREKANNFDLIGDEESKEFTSFLASLRAIEPYAGQPADREIYKKWIYALTRYEATYNRLMAECDIKTSVEHDKSEILKAFSVTKAGKEINIWQWIGAVPPLPQVFTSVQEMPDPPEKTTSYLAVFLEYPQLYVWTDATYDDVQFTVNHIVETDGAALPLLTKKDDVIVWYLTFCKSFIAAQGACEGKNPLRAKPLKDHVEMFVRNYKIRIESLEPVKWNCNDNYFRFVHQLRIRNLTAKQAAHLYEGFDPTQIPEKTIEEFWQIICQVTPQDVVRIYAGVDVTLSCYHFTRLWLLMMYCLAIHYTIPLMNQQKKLAKEKEKEKKDKEEKEDERKPSYSSPIAVRMNK